MSEADKDRIRDMTRKLMAACGSVGVFLGAVAEQLRHEAEGGPEESHECTCNMACATMLERFVRHLRSDERRAI